MAVTNRTRDASQYEATTHLIQRIKERDCLSFDGVAETIEEGEVIDRELTDGGEETLTLRHKWGAVYYSVVISTVTQKVVTACEEARQDNL